jgi:hypothetical protein
VTSSLDLDDRSSASNGLPLGVTGETGPIGSGAAEEFAVRQGEKLMPLSATPIFVRLKALGSRVAHGPDDTTWR